MASSSKGTESESVSPDSTANSYANSCVNSTLISVPNSHADQVIEFLNQKNFHTKTAYSPANSTSGGVGGVQDKSFSSVMENIVTPTLTASANVSAFL